MQWASQITIFYGHAPTLLENTPTTGSFVDAPHLRTALQKWPSMCSLVSKDVPGIAKRTPPWLLLLTVLARGDFGASDVVHPSAIVLASVPGAPTPGL